MVFDVVCGPAKRERGEGARPAQAARRTSEAAADLVLHVVYTVGRKLERLAKHINETTLQYPSVTTSSGFISLCRICE